eukprot:scaffold752_cov322-Pavlova_lutheri.AAC.24
MNTRKEQAHDWVLSKLLQRRVFHAPYLHGAKSVFQSAKSLLALRLQSFHDREESLARLDPMAFALNDSKSEAQEGTKGARFQRRKWLTGGCSGAGLADACEQRSASDSPRRDASSPSSECCSSSIAASSQWET